MRTFLAGQARIEPDDLRQDLGIPPDRLQRRRWRSHPDRSHPPARADGRRRAEEPRRARPHGACAGPGLRGHGSYRRHAPRPDRPDADAHRHRFHPRDARGGEGGGTPAVRSRRSRAGNRPCDVARTWARPARRDPGLPRQPHLLARCARRACLGDRIDRGRTCARHLDAAAAAAADDARHCGWGAGARRHRQGSRARPRRPVRCGQRQGPCRRICRIGGARARCRKPAHLVQHGNRIRRLHRDHRARRSGHRLSEGPPLRAVGAGVGPGGRKLARARQRR